MRKHNLIIFLRTIINFSVIQNNQVIATHCWRGVTFVHIVMLSTNVLVKTVVLAVNFMAPRLQITQNSLSECTRFRWLNKIHDTVVNTQKLNTHHHMLTGMHNETPTWQGETRSLREPRVKFSICSWQNKNGGFDSAGYQKSDQMKLVYMAALKGEEFYFLPLVC